VGATIRLCFQGLATFAVEFLIVFTAFSTFFYIMLNNDLENFRSFVLSLENTVAMSIGKFNFGAIRSSNEFAAWIFFMFSVVVNMILINMMIAIITMAFEEIKENEEKFQSKFQFVSYVKRRTREIVGLTMAEKIEPKYLTEEQAREEDESDEEERNA